MTEPFIGEIRAFANSFVPSGWALCDGSVIPVQGNETLFSIIGNNFYGGDGSTTFALPNLVDRVAMGVGMAVNMNNNVLGEQFGHAAVSLTYANMPAHNHLMQRKGHGMGIKTSAPTADSYIATIFVDNVSGTGQHSAENLNPGATPDTSLSSSMIGYAGGGQSHENQQPYLKMIYCIAMEGIFPSIPH